MRLLAWSRKVAKSTQKGKPSKRVERFDCTALCVEHHRFTDRRRALLGCTRIDLPPVAWDINVRRLLSGGWMGRAPIDTDEVGGIRINNRAAPPEDPSDGCPGGWQRSRFIATVQPFLRLRTEHGMRVPNLLLDRCEDDLVLQLVMFVEQEQEAFEAWAWNEIASG